MKKTAEVLTRFEEAILNAKESRISIETLIAKLVESQIFILSENDINIEKSDISPLTLNRDGVPMVAIFTHEKRADSFKDIAQYALQTTAKYIIKKIPNNAGLVINPGSTIGFEIPPEGVKKIPA